jgi:hypothetical protein
MRAGSSTLAQARARSWRSSARRLRPPAFEVLATNTLQDQVFIATPAIVDGKIYLRGQNTLFCIR